MDREKKNLFERFLKKPVKIVVKESDGIQVWVGIVEDVSSTHLLEKDRFNRLHLLRLSDIAKITELAEFKAGGESRNE